MVGTSLYYGHGFNTEQLREWADAGDLAAKQSLAMLAHARNAGWVADEKPRPLSRDATQPAAPISAADEIQAEIDRQLAWLAAQGNTTLG